MTERSDFYVYVWHRGDTDVPIYVGKGSGKRWRLHRYPNSHNKRVSRTLAKHGGRCEIVSQNITEKEAWIIEISLIHQFGREDLGNGTLFNLTNGGEGPSGNIASASTRLKMSIARRGKPKSLDTRDRMLEAWRNRELNQEEIMGRQKHCETNWQDPIIRSKMIDGLKKAWDPERHLEMTKMNERTWADPEIRRKRIEGIRAAALGRKQAPEVVERRAALFRGRKQSPEHVAKRMAAKASTRQAKLALSA